MEKAAIYIINSIQNGGAERVVLTQADSLLGRGIKVFIITLRDLEMYTYNSQIELIALSEQKKFSKLQYFTQILPLTRKINKILNRLFHQYDIVLLSSHLLYPNIITRLSSYKKKCIYVAHCSFFIIPYAKSFVFKKFMKWLYKNQQVVCVGVGVKHELQQFYSITQDTITAIHNPLDFLKIEEKLKEDFTPYPRPYLLFCGRLTDAKRPDRMLKSFYEGGFYRSHDLVFLGIGEWQDFLKERVKNYGIDNFVYFAQWQENPYQWMKHADLFVLSSDYEGFAMVILEALYCQCPVVAVNCLYGPNEIMIKDLTPYLCKPDVQDLIDKINMALQTYPDSLRDYTLPFDVNKHINQYLETYREWNS